MSLVLAHEGFRTSTHIPQVKLRKPSIFPDNDFPENRIDAIASFSAKSVYTNIYNINLSNGSIA
jgi:hypothetical protein